MAMLLTMLLTSCVSTRTEYKFIVPDIDFPTFPLADEIRSIGNGKCEVDEDWIINIAEYSIRIQETENNYREIKKLYENN